MQLLQEPSNCWPTACLLRRCAARSAPFLACLARSDVDPPRLWNLPPPPVQLPPSPSAKRWSVPSDTQQKSHPKKISDLVCQKNGSIAGSSTS